MRLKAEATEIISALTRNGFRASCHCCRETFALSRASLFYGENLTARAKEILTARYQELADQKADIKERKRKLASVSEQLAVSVNLGCVVERLAPSLTSFPFDVNDCRSLFEPLDYVIFHGLTERGVVERIVFADIKTGRARLNEKQKTIKRLIENGKVTWETYTRD